MKKIALSAGIMALMMMMGCSDAGLDNTVASTSEAQDEQVLQTSDKVPVLKRYVENAPLSPGYFRKNYNGYEVYRYSQYGEDYVVEMQTLVDGLKGVGVYHVKFSLNAPDAIHIVTVAVAGCSVNGNNVECSYHKSKVSHNYGKRKLEHYTAELPSVYRGQIGVVSAYAAAWNINRWNEVILNSSTYNGLDYTTAFLVYQKYVIDAFNEDLQNH